MQEGFGGLKEALMGIGQECAQEEKKAEEAQVMVEAPRDCSLPTDLLQSEISVLTKKAEIAKKANTRRVKKVDHSKGYYDTLSSKDKMKRKAIQRPRKNRK